MLDEFVGYEATSIAKMNWTALGKQVIRGYKNWLTHRLGGIRQTEYDCKSSIWVWFEQDAFKNTPTKYKHFAGYLTDPIQFGELLWNLENS